MRAGTLSEESVVTEPIVLTSDMVTVLAILALTIYLFAFEVVRVDLAALDGIW